MVRHSIKVLLILILNSCWLYGQHYTVHANLVQKDTLRVAATLSVNDKLPDSIKFRLYANGYKSNTSNLSLKALENYYTHYYFAKERDMGGYHHLTCKLNGKSQIIHYDATEENAYLLVDNVTESKTEIEWNYDLKIPKNHLNFGKGKNYTVFHNWVPEPVFTDIDSIFYHFTIPDTLLLLYEGSTLSKNKASQSDYYYLEDSLANGLLIIDETWDSTLLTSPSGNDFTLLTKDYKKNIAKTIFVPLLSSLEKNKNVKSNGGNYILNTDHFGFIKGVSLVEINKMRTRKKWYKFLPIYRYMDDNMHMVGYKYTNINSYNKSWRYIIQPMYSFENDLLGYLEISKKMQPKKGLLSSVLPMLSYRKSHYFKNADRKYTLDYHKISPSISFYFNQKKHIKKELVFQYTHIIEEYATLTATEYSISHLPSNLLRIKYSGEREKPLSSIAYWTELDQFNYISTMDQKTKHFTKISGAFTKSWLTSPTKSFVIRFFASYFLKNDGRESTNFSNAFTKGSISLIHQGQNDYAYDELFVTRKNQTGIFNNQVSSHGGGFKNAPSSSSSAGLSNDFAFAINTYYHLPISYKNIKTGLYLDAGGYRTWNKGLATMQYLYSGGFFLNIGNKIEFYLPLLNHKDITQNYVDSKQSFFGRWSFNIKYYEKY